MRSIAIITARGGSKRIPGKNIKTFCGKPIISYSIEAALQSGMFEEVMVSTDSLEISDIALQYGAKVPFLRSAKTSGDYATTNDVIAEVLREYDSKSGKSFEFICCIYPTAPFITADDLKNAFRLLESDPSIDSVMPVVRYSFPPQRAMIIRDGHIKYQFPENALKRSQDLEPVFHDCGQFYLCRTAAFFKHNDLLGSNTAPIEIPEERVQDIDSLSDWAIAEMKFCLLTKR